MTRTKRIGAILSATNPVREPDFYGVIFKDITVHFERMWNGRSAKGTTSRPSYKKGGTQAEGYAIDSWILQRV